MKNKGFNVMQEFDHTRQRFVSGESVQTEKGERGEVVRAVATVGGWNYVVRVLRADGLWVNTCCFFGDELRPAMSQKVQAEVVRAVLGRYATGFRMSESFAESFARRRRQDRAWMIGGALVVLTVGAAFWWPWAVVL